jgi:hypothetical protein
MQVVDVVPGESTILVRLEVTDNTSRQYLLTPVRLEKKDENGWKKCPGSLSGFADPPMGVDITISRCSIFVMPQSPGAQLRLVVDVQRPRQGLGTFWERLRLRLSGQNKQVSLNPFDTRDVIFTKVAEVISDEFIQK